MRIIHYSLGFPPFRTGGMTKYCMDLMAEQVRQGHDVGLLWPGELGSMKSDIAIRSRKKHRIRDGIAVDSYEIRNPLPVPLLNGIADINAYTQTKDVDAFKQFFTDLRVEAFHVHTLMGLPAEALQACCELGIATVFTSHDYFGICAKWGLERGGMPCVDDHNCADCVACNQSALSLGKVRFLQSNLYRMVKDTKIIKQLRARNNKSLYIDEHAADENATQSTASVQDGDAARYRKLRRYYVDMLEAFDVLHFNSTNTMTTYGRYCDVSRGKVASITHVSIRDNKALRNSHRPVRFGYLGPITRHKGFFLLKKACDVLWDSGVEFKLHIYARIEGAAPYMVMHDPYRYEELPQVMDTFDALVVPSQWYETFGFTVLEALSYGLPVIVTENVGAKDLIRPGENGLIVKPEKNALAESMKTIANHPETLSRMNTWIKENQRIKTIQQHAEEIVALYQ